MVPRGTDLGTFPHSYPIIEDDTREGGAGSPNKDEVVAEKHLGSDGVKSLAGAQDGWLESVPYVEGTWTLPSTFDAICTKQIAQYLIKDGGIESS